MSIASKEHAKAIFAESKRRLSDRVAVNVNNSASVARQIARGSKSSDIIMQSAKQLAQQEVSIENSMKNLNKVKLIQQQLGYQHAAIREGCQILDNVKEQVSSGRTPQYQRTPPRNGRIFGGHPADIADFQHMLVLLDLTFNGFICGASAIHLRWALTAAHCLEFGTPASEINLRGGSTNRLSGGFIFFTQFYTLHPQYDPNWLDFDIALIRVQDSSLMQGPNVTPVPISPPCASSCCHTCEHDSDHVTITGWGLTEHGTFPINLLQITLPVHNHADCDRIWTGIGDFFMCVTSEPGRDSCNGDSGSPLVRFSGESRVQMALVSFGTSQCGTGQAPSVNTRIEYPPIRNWITETTLGDV
ncbi:hypothetical protein PVAND_014897 [Polypedilum vanderplanki]|uniref:BLOC-1-related complex subunit 7 n=1 Tax=Polypedilum vanderplanki TaxID=319348 RepID=A0A9J6BB23_POLVA|nr:hypothetical protein PVAND_014897 [Polypedilum vanderplanki]